MSNTITFKSNSSTIKPNQIKNLLIQYQEKYDYEIKTFDDKHYSLWFNPTGFLYVEINEYYILGEIDTTYIGPGFHHHIIQFIDEVFSNYEKFNLSDDTKYWEDRDFNRLQTYFVERLKEDLYFLSSNRLDEVYYWIFEWKPLDIKGIATHLGIFDHDEVLNFIDNGKIEELAKRYFIWYNEEKDDNYFLNSAFFYMNCIFTWVKPRHQEEEKIANAILKYLEKAYSINNNIKLPIKEIEDIKYLLDINNNSIVHTNQNKMIGYRRKKLEYKISSYWKVIMDGELNYDNDEGWDVFFDNDRAIRLKCRFKDKEFTPDLSENDSERIIKHEDENYKYQAKYFLNEENKLWILDGEILSNDFICYVNIISKYYYDYDWVCNNFKNIKPVRITDNNFYMINGEYNFEFSDRGIVFFNTNLFIAYQNIDFKLHLNNANDYLFLLYFKNEKYPIEEGQVIFSEELLHWIKKYDLIVENLDLFYETPSKGMKKYNFQMKETSLAKPDKIVWPIFFIILNLLSLSLFFDKTIRNRFIIVLSVLIIINVVLYYSYSYATNRKLIITKKGITYFSRYFTKKRIFICYENLKSIQIENKSMKIIGKNSEINFKYYPKVIQRISQFIDINSIDIKYVN